MGTNNTVLLDYLKKNLTSSLCMLDIGSKTGKWLSPFVYTFPEGDFHCFEALPEHYEKLKHRYRKYNNVSFYNFAISDNEENTIFYRDKIRRGWSGLRKHQYLEDYDEIILETKTIDTFNLKPNVIKIDVEGAELLVFRGAIKTLKTCWIIFFECNEVHFKEYNYTAKDLYDFLISENFKIFSLDLQEIAREEFIFLTADARRYEDPKSYQSNFLAINMPNIEPKD